MHVPQPPWCSALVAAFCPAGTAAWYAPLPGRACGQAHSARTHHAALRLAHVAQVYTVQLHNARQVAAEWSIKKPAIESPKLKDWDHFKVRVHAWHARLFPAQPDIGHFAVPVAPSLQLGSLRMCMPFNCASISGSTTHHQIEPTEGVLEPGVRMSLRVTFTPLLGREAPYALWIPLKVANNPRNRELVCNARGNTPKVRARETGRGAGLAGTGLTTLGEQSSAPCAMRRWAMSVGPVATA
jgi:hypothetical protein